jgi:hypothetical protein
VESGGLKFQAGNWAFHLLDGMGARRAELAGAIKKQNGTVDAQPGVRFERVMTEPNESNPVVTSKVTEQKFSMGNADSKKIAGQNLQEKVRL